VEELLKEAKRKISERHLGHHGIHGVGLRTSESALCIYVDPGSRLEGTETLREIKNEAAPFKIVLVEEERPSILLPRTSERRVQKARNRKK
jgi:hypothetical protein